MELVHYSATRVKKSLTGNGRASKQQVQLMVAQELGLTLPINPVDITDALAQALAWKHIEG
jgi:crossover junction endodeoxyribonuclease RuvC